MQDGERTFYQKIKNKLWFKKKYFNMINAQGYAIKVIDLCCQDNFLKLFRIMV